MKNNNIKRNNLSLKSLQAELEKLKSSNSPTSNATQTVTTNDNGKQKITTRFYSHSSMMLLWVFTGILSYAHKIPFISKLIKLLALWYGRTTWWKLLITFRKVFVVVNALIGVLAVFKITGFSTDNIIAGIYNLGCMYVDVFTSFTSGLFRWFLNLFDYKIVPSVPKNPTIPKWPGVRNGWGSKPMVDDGIGRIMDLAKNQEFYRTPATSTHWNIFTPSEWSLTTWLWYTGIAVVSFGLIYVGYSIYCDPTIINGLFGYDYKGKGPMPPTAPTGGESPPPVDIELNDVRTDAGPSTAFTLLGSKISALNRSIVNTLNPFNYFTSSSESVKDFTTFMSNQANAKNVNTHYYPFTEHNPYDSWLKKLRISMLGESALETADRLKDKEHVMELARLPYKSAFNTSVMESVSGIVTPATEVGIGHTPIITNSFFERLQNASIEHRFNNIAPTPVDLPGTHSEWINHTKDSYESSDAVTSSVFSLDDDGKNPFNHLGEVTL